MSYRILPSSLYSTAEAAKKFCKKTWGVSKFCVEEPITTEVEFRPTIRALSRDHHYLCVEVSESAYTNPLDAFVLDCKNRCLPVTLYVAIPKGVRDPDFQSKLKRAKNNGVGIIEIDASGGQILNEALSLSLTGLRPINPEEFPTKYRSSLHSAESTFHNGNPHKACADLYDEIEALTRRIAAKTKTKGFWRMSPQKPVKIDLQKGSWADLVAVLMKHLDSKKCGCPGLDRPLLARVLGITSHRNQTGHKPRNRKEPLKRDRELRTRFENGLDILADLIAASKPLNV